MDTLEYSSLHVKGSDAHYERGTVVKGRTVRVRVRLNSYDFQSHAIAEVWTGDAWSEVAHLHHEEYWVSPYATYENIAEATEEAENELLARTYATL